MCVQIVNNPTFLFKSIILLYVVAKTNQNINITRNNSNKRINMPKIVTSIRLGLSRINRQVIKYSEQNTNRNKKY